MYLRVTLLHTRWTSASPLRRRSCLFPLRIRAPYVRCRLSLGVYAPHLLPLHTTSSQPSRLDEHTNTHRTIPCCMPSRLHEHTGGCPLTLLEHNAGSGLWPSAAVCIVGLRPLLEIKASWRAASQRIQGTLAAVRCPLKISCNPSLKCRRELVSQIQAGVSVSNTGGS